jgi:mitochondrial fission protein ELM1
MLAIASMPHVDYAATMKEPVTCWAISDGAAGNERQALALARALGLDPHVLVRDMLDRPVPILPSTVQVIRELVGTTTT